MRHKITLPHLRNKSALLLLVLSVIGLTGCGIYSFKDVSIDYSKLKTIKVGFIENKARYVSAGLSSNLTTKLQQKIMSQTKLVSTNNDDANLQLSGYISDYSVTTVAVTTTQATTNRLTVSVQMTLKNLVDNKTEDFTVTKNFDFSASLSLQQAETQLNDQILQNMTDEIFNHIFSNW